MDNKALEEYHKKLDGEKYIVTVFMLTYKRPDYVKIAIESVLRQTYKDFLLVVLDNMSGDETESVVKSFTDSRLIYIEHDGNLTGSNYAYAFQLVETKYVVVMHDDDVYEANYLEDVVNQMVSHPDLTAISPVANIIDSCGNLVRKGLTYEGIKTYKNDDYFKDFFKGQLALGMVFPAVIYSTELFGNVYDYLDKKTGPAGDQFIWFEIGRRGGRIAILGEPLINYRVHNKQDSSVNAGTLLFDLVDFLYTMPYYATRLNEHSSYLYQIIRASLASSLDNYHKGIYSKVDLKRVYEKIPENLKYNKKCIKYVWLFKIATLFPKSASFLMKWKRSLKKYD